LPSWILSQPTPQLQNMLTCSAGSALSATGTCCQGTACLLFCHALCICTPALLLEMAAQTAAQTACCGDLVNSLVKSHMHSEDCQ
jgi:hypothetical protein